MKNKFAKSNRKFIPSLMLNEITKCISSTRGKNEFHTIV